MKPFLQGKKSLDVSPLRLPPGLAANNAATRDSSRAPAAATRVQSNQAHHDSHTSSAAGAHVELVKEGDKVVRLIVTCTCGERIEVECLYPAGT